MSFPIEHTWYLAKYISDPMRNETRNVAVVLRTATTLHNSSPRIRFLDPPPFLKEEHANEWKGWKSYWESVWDKHGEKPFYWIAKPSAHSPHFVWTLGGSRIVPLVDFGEMFELLVKPENR